MYALENQGSYTKRPSYKRSFYLLMLACTFFVLGVLYAFMNQKGLISMLLPILFLMVTLVRFLSRVNDLRIWKKGLKDYLDRLESFQSQKIILSDNTFTLIQDHKEVIERWSNFRKVIVHKNCIELVGSKNYFIPEKAIEPNEYLTFKAIITQNLAK
jgi:hypothetical protein